MIKRGWVKEWPKYRSAVGHGVIFRRWLPMRLRGTFPEETHSATLAYQTDTSTGEEEEQNSAQHANGEEQNDQLDQTPLGKRVEVLVAIGVHTRRKAEVGVGIGCRCPTAFIGQMARRITLRTKFPMKGHFL